MYINKNKPNSSYGRPMNMGDSPIQSAAFGNSSIPAAQEKRGSLGGSKIVSSQNPFQGSVNYGITYTQDDLQAAVNQMAGVTEGLTDKSEKKGKRIRLEEEKEMRIKEFMAAKRKEYEKYVALDFDYRVVEDEIRKIERIDYTQLDHDQERIRLNKLQLKGNHAANRNLGQQNEEEDRGEESYMNSNLEANQNYNNPPRSENVIHNLIDKLRVFVVPLQDNLFPNEDSLRTIPADMLNHQTLGPSKYCGTVLKKISDRAHNEEVWVVVRGFYIFLYNDSNSLVPLQVIKVPLMKMGLEVMKPPGIGNARGVGIGQQISQLKHDSTNLIYFSVQEKPGSSKAVQFLIGKAGDSKHLRHGFYDFMKRQVAIKTYLFICGYLNVAPDQNLMKFYENDEAELLKINFQTKIIDNLISIHPVLKSISEAFFYYSFIVASHSKCLLAIDFSDLGLWSKFLVFFFNQMSEDSVRCPLEVLKLDNNDVTDEVLNSLAVYMLLPQSFRLKRLSINDTDFGDSGTSIIGRMLSERHMRMRDSASNSLSYQLPLEFLSLNNVKMGDQGLYNFVIQLEKVQKENTKRGIVDYDQFLELHLAQNEITEKSLSSLGSLLYFFQGVSVLNVSESRQIMCIQKEKFFEQLKHNYSLTTLNISKIDMNIDSFRSLLSLLEENYTLVNIQISLTEAMIKDITKSKNTNLLKYFMISYNPNLILDSI